MTGDRVTLFHSVPRTKLALIAGEGLIASSGFDDLELEIRRGVVFCWLRPEDDKMWGANPEYTQVQATVDVCRCRVADMDFSSIALMYLQGQGGRPRNTQAAALAAKLHDVTSVPLSNYRDGMFCTPEVLVKGDIVPEDITVIG